jgi:uncharacterized membrane protein
MDEDETYEGPERRSDSAVVDRILSALGIGELRSDVKHLSKTVEEIREDQKSMPRFDPETCRAQQTQIDRLKDRVGKVETGFNRVLGGLILLNIIWAAVIILEAAGRIHIG